MIERGTVVSFNPHKRFGFVLVEGGRETFFHLGDYGSPELRPAGTIYLNPRLRTSRLPLPGMKLVFTVVPATKGLKAYPWTFADDYERLEQQGKAIITENSTVYRVMERFDPVGAMPGNPAVKFEGTLAMLNRRHPRHMDSRFDDLRDFGHGDFSVQRWLERKQGDDWVRCDDPRAKLTGADFRRARRGH